MNEEQAAFELQELVQALRAHVEWARGCGSIGLPMATSDWLDGRREQYRRHVLLEERAELPTRENDPSSLTQVPAGERSGALSMAPAPHAEATPPGAVPRPVHAPEGPAPHAQPAPDSRPQDAPSILAPSLAAPSLAARSLPHDPALTETRAPEARTSEAHPATGEPAPSPDVAAHPAKLPVIQPSAEALAALARLETEVKTCTRCALHESRTHAVFARGNGSSGVCFVGEGPGADEDARGSPFVGKAGQLLDRMIAAMGLSRDDVYVCNVVKCRPPNNRKPSPEEMGACRGFLEAQLGAIRPRVIVALGATAVEGLLGISVGITRLRGTWRLYQGKIPVMPTFHPAYLLRQPDAKRQVWQDLQQVLSHLNLEVPKR